VQNNQSGEQENTSPSSSDSNVRKSQVIFSGNGKEYFNIWIVNLLLTILTVGIYSAWAKVRTNRYFYSHTDLDGHKLRYLAEPLQILKGRIIAVILFTLYYFAATFNPAAGLVIILILFAASPLLICMSIRFQMRMTSYRNVKFGFNGRYGRAFVVFVLFPILTVFTLYLALPWALKKIDEFIYENITFGDRKFNTNIRNGKYYIATLASIGAFLAVFIIAAIPIALTPSFSLATLKSNPQAMSGIVAAIMIFAYVFSIILSGCVNAVIIRNHLFNHTGIEGVVRFHSDMKILDLVKLRLVNFVLMIITLGLASPWIKVRVANFYAQATQMEVTPEADKVIAKSKDGTSAIGEEVSDIFDIDVGLA